MASQRTSHKIGKDVSRPHQQQQIQQQECARRLFPNLHQETQRQRDIGERKCRSHGRGKAGAEIGPPHADHQKHKRRDGGRERRAAGKYGSGQQRRVMSEIHRQKQEEQADKNVSRPVERPDLVGFGQS